MTNGIDYCILLTSKRYQNLYLDRRLAYAWPTFRLSFRYSWSGRKFNSHLEGPMINLSATVGVFGWIE